MFKRSNGLESLLDRPGPSAWQRFTNAPCLFLASIIYSWRHTMPIIPVSPVNIVCISDTHNRQPAIPDGDLLIHAGDLTQSGTPKELQTSLDWLNSLPHPHKIVIAGNHDTSLDLSQNFTEPVARERISWGNIIYLNNESTTVSIRSGRQLRIFGSPLSPCYGNWPFQYPRKEDVWKDLVPEDTDILITHTPPRTHLDLGNLGCKSLLREIWRKKPRLHIFGHVHDGHGQEWVYYDALQKAYEDLQMAGGGIWRLGRVVLEFVATLLTPQTEARGLLVNAAIVGGHRDEKRRSPITVVI